MKSFSSLLLVLSLFSVIFTAFGQTCDFGWTAYKDSKCFKLLPDFVTLTEAETLCLTEAGGSSNDTPPILTIKSSEEQDFISQLIFGDSQVVDNVWLGARRIGGSNQFEWNDGSAVDYTNWHQGSPSSILTNECTQMVPKGVRTGTGTGAVPMDDVDGRWTDVSCLKRNLVICQKLQPWTMLKLQQVVLELTKTVQDTKENPVPIGFVYVQLPNQADAQSTWPDVQWTDVTSQYAGLFLRAEGGNAAPFGTVQEDATRQIRTMEYSEGTSSYPLTLALPTSGWSQYGRGGGFYTSGSAYHYEGLRFEVSNTEVRPRNTAVRFWKRIA